jgi:hypothetical protein
MAAPEPGMSPLRSGRNGRQAEWERTPAAESEAVTSGWRASSVPPAIMASALPRAICSAAAAMAKAPEAQAAETDHEGPRALRAWVMAPVGAARVVAGPMVGRSGRLAWRRLAASRDLRMGPREEPVMTPVRSGSGWRLAMETAMWAASRAQREELSSFRMVWDHGWRRQLVGGAGQPRSVSGWGPGREKLSGWASGERLVRASQRASGPWPAAETTPMPVTTMGSWARRVARLRRGATMGEEAAVRGGGLVGKLRLAVARGWGVWQREG